MSDFGMNLCVINEDDKVIDVLPSKEIHQKGLLHRAMHILVLNGHGQIYARKRSQHLELYPGVWTSSVGEHVFENETYEQTAARAAKEFLGLETPCNMVNKIRVQDNIENELVAVFTTQSNNIPHLSLEHSEEGSFLDRNRLHQLIDSGQTTPHLASCLKVVDSGD